MDVCEWMCVYGRVYVRVYSMCAHMCGCVYRMSARVCVISCEGPCPRTALGVDVPHDAQRLQVVQAGVQANLVEDRHASRPCAVLQCLHCRRLVAGRDEVASLLDARLCHGKMHCVRQERDDNVVGRDEVAQRGSVRNVQGDGVGLCGGQRRQILCCGQIIAADGAGSD